MCVCVQVKLDQHQAAAGKPSKVLHFRGVPSDTSEGEIVQLGLPFGNMTNLVLAKKKNQVSELSRCARRLLNDCFIAIDVCVWYMFDQGRTTD